MSELNRNRNLMMFYAALILAIAPFGVGVIRYVQTGSDVRYFYVALSAFIGAVAVMLIGRARSQPEAVITRLAGVAFLVSTLLAVLAGRLVGARAMFGVIAVAVVMALFFTGSMILFVLSRPRTP